MNYLLPLIAVILGYILALVIQPKKKSNLKLLLAFSGSFLLSVTVISLLPVVYETKNTTIGLYIMLGILFQIILEFFSKGAEHVQIPPNSSCDERRNRQITQKCPQFHWCNEKNNPSPRSQ